MITLHDVFQQGNDRVRAAVLAFGTRHPADFASPDSEPNWKKAEKHFTHIIEMIMGSAVLPPPDSADGPVRRAENAAVGFLLAVNVQPNYRCPICVKMDGT
ncbi:hypothetical protein [Streptomyces naphthomycinicus]|uniref:hypothetical protein n=1 Tax=Streptomyces naphthomycinicus TaxID=2872625 RepID=UPI001CECAC42|nr:hypothetical protein [Streptomyces sp. TML10]